MILLGVLLLLATLSSYGEESLLSSNQAAYDGTQLTLKGEVLLDHGLGKIYAEEAILKKQELGMEFPFSQIDLRKSVLFQLCKGEELSCDHAILDFNALQGLLTSSQLVTYTGTLHRGKEKLPFKLQGQTIELLLKKEPSPKESVTKPLKEHFNIQEMKVKEHVQLSFGEGYLFSSDAISYEKYSNTSSSLRSSGKALTTFNCTGDQIEAEYFQIVEGVVSMKKPRGNLFSLSREMLFFQAEELIWENFNELLTLKGKIFIEEPFLGTFTSDNEVSVSRKEGGLAAFKSLGNTTFHDPHHRLLQSHGTWTFDKFLKSSVIESPIIEQKVPKELQLYYEEGNFGMYANQAQVDYAEEKGVLKPISIAVKGGIQFFSLPKEELSRFGLADHLRYHPTTQTMILLADPPNKVLLIDQREKVSLSAQEIHITRDSVTEREMIKGIGNVRFLLTAEEQLKLKHYFPHGF